MDNFSVIIKDILANSDFILSDRMINQFIKYAELLVDWNKKINLTAITCPDEIATKHFIDSLSIINAVETPIGANVIDVGTGAGFPGIPMKIIRPDIHLTLLDSLNKRLIFLNELISNIDIDANLIHSRAEDAARSLNYREKFDIVVSRAVAPLNVLLEYCMPFVKINGKLVSLKGSNAKKELNDAQNAMKCLNAEIVDIRTLSLINQNDRNIIIFDKPSKNSNIYPRHSSKMAKKPL